MKWAFVFQLAHICVINITRYKNEAVFSINSLPVSISTYEISRRRLSVSVSKEETILCSIIQFFKWSELDFQKTHNDLMSYFVLNTCILRQ